MVISKDVEWDNLIPQQDLEYIKLREQYAKIPEKDKENNINSNYNIKFWKRARDFIVHANFPKLNPWKLKQREENI